VGILQMGCCCRGGIDPCQPTCFRVTACGAPAAGASLRVFACATPGTTIATGTADAAGEWCVSLSAYVGTTLCVTIDYAPSDYRRMTATLLGSFCGRTYSYNLVPGTDATGGSGTPGTITVCCKSNCAGTTSAGSGREVKILTSPGLATVATGSTGSDGCCTFTGITTGAAYIAQYTSSLFQVVRSAAFTLAVEASVVLRSNPLWIDPDLGATPCADEEDVTLVGDEGTPATTRHCCLVCAPDSIPATLYADVEWTVLGGPDCEASHPTTVELHYYGAYWIGSALITFTDWAGASHTEQLVITLSCNSAFGADHLVLVAKWFLTCSPCRSSNGWIGVPWIVMSQNIIDPTSLTCDPFIGVWDADAGTATCFDIFNNSYPHDYPSLSITVYE
jgi:hypothetical protein